MCDNSDKCCGRCQSHEDLEDDGCTRYEDLQNADDEFVCDFD